jgi:hypothetical protein
MKMVERARHSANAKGPIDETREADSKVTLETCLQSAKQRLHKTPTEEGMQMARILGSGSEISRDGSSSGCAS